MIQTKCTPETRRRKWMIVSTVYLVPMTASRQLISMRGSSATSDAALARSEIPCSRPVSFSGLPGVSSHQTRSSFRRLSANRLMARCAACGGLNEPPSRPMRMPLVWKGMACAADCNCISPVTACTGWSLFRFDGIETGLQILVLTRFLDANRFPLRSKTLWRSRPRLPGAVNAIFEARQLLGADRAAGVEFASGNPDLRAEAELAAIGELRRRVVQHDRGIDLAQEFPGRPDILGHDRIGVARAMVLNMRDRSVDAVDDTRGDDRVEILGIPIVVGRRLHPRVDLLHGVVAAHLAAGFEQHLDQRLQIRSSGCAIDQQGLGGAADAGAAHLGVQHDRLGHLEFGGSIDIDVVDAFEMRKHRYARFRLDARDQALAAARHDHVDTAT